MKIICSREALLREVSIAQEVVSSRNSLSVLSNVLLTARRGALVIQATDLKVGFETSIPVEVVTEGTATAFCDKLLNIVRSLPEGDVEIEQVDAAMLRIRPTKGKIDFRVNDGLLTISSKESELGLASEEVACDYTGPDLTFAVNCQYLIEPLREMDCERVRLEFSDVNKALTLKPQPEEGYLNIIMPMQLD